MSDTDAARKLLEDDGYVVLRKKSYEHTLRKLQGERVMRQCAEEHAERNQQWVEQRIGPDQKLLYERIAFLYGAARAHGASAEELSNQPGMMTREEQRIALGLPPEDPT